MIRDLPSMTQVRQVGRRAAPPAPRHQQLLRAQPCGFGCVLDAGKCVDRRGSDDLEPQHQLAATVDARLNGGSTSDHGLFYGCFLVIEAIGDAASRKILPNSVSCCRAEPSKVPAAAPPTPRSVQGHGCTQGPGHSLKQGGCFTAVFWVDVIDSRRKRLQRRERTTVGLRH